MLVLSPGKCLLIKFPLFGAQQNGRSQPNMEFSLQNCIDFINLWFAL